ncbi:MAG TPA: cytochrome c oxidase accessory protein CcoG [Lacunisphaera sp.]
MSADHKPASPRRSVPRPVVDSVTTIASDGSRRDLHPADVHGRFTRARRWSGWALIAFYLVLPWIPVNGHPAVFLDLAERRFHFFGYTLAAQDAWLLFFGVTGLGFALFFLTALFGRLWCGWACPQTVYLEHVYRVIERWIDGDATERRALAAAPLTAAKAAKRVAKHGLYIVASLLITHLFLSYFVSLPEVWHMMHYAPGEHWAAFVFVFAAAGVLYFNFAWFREQLCIVICPYGRLQSALTDDHSLSIGYDAQRGEPRGKLGTPDAGACVDCNRCVQVCPTGIDIRHGLQLECIGCAACIDACDEVMTRVKRPVGLIRYDSFAGLGGGVTRWIRPRTILYGVLLCVGIAVAAFAFTTVKPANFLVFRTGGASYFVGPEDVRNQFMVRLVNKRTEPATFVVTSEGLPAGLRQSGFEAPVTLAPMAESVSPLVLVASRRDYRGPFKFTVRVRDAAQTFTLAREVEFMGPDARLLEDEEHEEREKKAKEHHDPKG